jgi:hypothetical protein
VEAAAQVAAVALVVLQMLVEPQEQEILQVPLHLKEITAEPDN